MTYLTKENITHYLKQSSDNGKMLIATDACGAGKTTAMLDWVAANPDWSVVIVVERKDQAETYRTSLIERGIQANDIAVLNSEHPEELKKKYAFGSWYSKRICIITHARLWLDPPQLWRSYRFRGGNILLIDEILLETIRSVRVNPAFLSTVNTYVGFDIGKYRNCFDEKWESEELRTITPQDQETILRYLSLLYARLLDASRQEKDVKGDILEGISKIENLDSPLDTPKFDTPERLAYFACLITYSILMGKVREVPGSLVKKVTIISPILLWSHEFDASVLFDGTGELHPYPRDSCSTVVPAVIQPRPLLNIKMLPISGDKRTHRNRVEQEPELYYREIRNKLSSVLTGLAETYKRIYVCTWRDKETEEYEHWTSDFRSDEIEKETIVRIKDRPVFEVEPVLKLESLLWSLVDELELTQRVFVSHYGLSRGSNAFRDYDCVLLVGQFYYPQWKYHDFVTYSTVFSPIKQNTVPTYNGKPLPFVLGYLIQECMRVRARQGHPVDCYLCLESSDRDYSALLQGFYDLKSFDYYVRSIEKSDLSGRIVASEQNVKFQYLIRECLTKKQERRMVRLAEAYPSLLTERQVSIDATELGRLWECRSDDVRSILRSIEKRSKGLITHQIVEPGRQGRSSAQLSIALCPLT